MNRAQEIKTAWARIAPFYDPVAGDKEAHKILRNPIEHTEEISQALEHIRLIDRSTHGTVSRLNYQFCFEPCLWQRSGEAVLQARALQQIATWCDAQPQADSMLRDVVVRHTFDPRHSFAPPQHVPSEGFHFLVIRFAYQELLMLSARALVELLTGRLDGNAWELLATADNTGQVRGEAPRLLRQLLGRMLTSEAFHPLISKENPLRQLCQRSKWFDKATESYGGGITSFEVALSYSGQDFAIAHELGHCLATQSFELRFDEECAADLAGFGLYALSWGWRDEILEECPLGQASRISLGPTWFFYTAKLLYTVRTLLSRRWYRLGLNPWSIGLLDEDMTELSFIVARWESSEAAVQHYLAEVQRRGAVNNPGDYFVVRNLVRSMDAFLYALEGWIEDIPEEDILFVEKLVRDNPY
ncbi:hypothetical protein [Nitrosospira multiformis]|uniref:Uncharacterized protein n=1 Tax=Nitrosospira multiformis TaxID=1231 RepID=A0A1I7I537_9PROT|nr:hypothetical protein [Nitrosospira multiformis]SFU68023.1 hypothetical protein SAMN05216417_11464 [Nitrosospira multiformis]